MMIHLTLVGREDLLMDGLTNQLWHGVTTTDRLQVRRKGPFTHTPVLNTTRVLGGIVMTRHVVAVAPIGLPRHGAKVVVVVGSSSSSSSCCCRRSRTTTNANIQTNVMRTPVVTMIDTRTVACVACQGHAVCGTRLQGLAVHVEGGWCRGQGHYEQSSQ